MCEDWLNLRRGSVSVSLWHICTLQRLDQKTSNLDVCGVCMGVCAAEQDFRFV